MRKVDQVKVERALYEMVNQSGISTWEDVRKFEDAIHAAESGDFPSQGAYLARPMVERARRRLEWRDETKQKLDELAMEGRHFTEKRKIMDIYRTRAERYTDAEARIRNYCGLLIHEGYITAEQAATVSLKPPPPSEEELAERREAYQEVQALNEALNEILGASSSRFEGLKVYNLMGGALTANKLDTFVDKLAQENLLPAFWRQKKQARQILHNIRTRLRGDK